MENTVVSTWEDLFEQRSLRRREALQAKSEKNSFELAFCGHFSAGKSSVINDLLGHDILPTSPIPTSANIISIKKGEVALELVDQDGSTRKWEQEIPWDKARKWGMDGNAIKEMTIYGPFPFLEERAAIIDTPGVDSTDPDHQKITASQLFTTDMIVYVTDYNHVQSETNIEFLQQLSREKKPIVLVINQIDKHNDKELSIQSFENAVRNMLAKSNIRILSLFFTSMKEESHPLNQKQDFTRFIKAVLYHSDSLKNPSIQALQTAAVYDLLEQLEDEQEEAWENWEEEVRTQGMDPSVLQKIDRAEEDRSKEEAEKKEKLAQTAKERKQILENAILFPHMTTEKAKSWLESMDPGFKTGGLLKSKKKIEAEREKREAELYEDLNEKIKNRWSFICVIC
ncbi:dynamin family protein [Sinobaca sp. H24]|uniref:dynamin family protein n=1 Tax=Sinobaca sp. H24 TaxID=2923376 RepID=UPI00207B0B7E|nr:dynamin family protein [Sinobaca sp. H24]